MNATRKWEQPRGMETGAFGLTKTGPQAKVSLKAPLSAQCRAQANARVTATHPLRPDFRADGNAVGEIVANRTRDWVLAWELRGFGTPVRQES